MSQKIEAKNIIQEFYKCYKDNSMSVSKNSEQIMLRISVISSYDIFSLKKEYPMKRPVYTKLDRMG